MGKNPPADAEIPEFRPLVWDCVPQLLGLCSRARKPQLLAPVALELVLCSKRSHFGERLKHHSRRVAPAPAAGEKPESKKAQDSQTCKTLILSKHKVSYLTVLHVRSLEMKSHRLKSGIGKTDSWKL